MALFGGSSSHVTSTLTQVDNTVSSTEGNATAVQLQKYSTGNNIHIGSDDVALKALDNADNLSIRAIDSAHDNFYMVTDFLENTLSDVLSLSDSRAASADANYRASQDFVREIVGKNQETADDRLIKVVTMAGVLGVAVIALQSGVFK